MSLYLAIFDGPREVAGWVFGHYSDFALFRDFVARVSNGREWPTLMEHSDSDGEWSVDDLPALRRELISIADEFKRHPPETLVDGFEHTAQYRKGAKTLFDCFHNVDGTNIFDALLRLCDEGERVQLPISFS